MIEPFEAKLGKYSTEICPLDHQAGLVENLFLGEDGPCKFTLEAFIKETLVLTLSQQKNRPSTCFSKR